MKEYFPKVFKKPFGKNHLRLIDALQRCILEGGKQAVAMPRGTGKTSITTFTAVWAFVYGHRRMLMIFAATQKAARKILARIHKALKRDGRLLADFPEIGLPFAELGGSALLARGQICNGKPTNIGVNADTLTCPTVRGSAASGSVIMAIGVTGTFLGENADLPDGTNIRPDFLMLDDLQKDDVAKNPLRVEDLENKINASLEGLVESGNVLSMVMTCTVKQPDDLSDRYLDPEKYPHWNGIRGKMIEQFPERMDLWREFRSRRHQNATDARTFYVEHREEMNAGAVLSWPDGHNPKHFIDSLEMAMVKWCDNERAFWSEYQNEPLRDPGSAVVVPAKTIMQRVNGLERQTVPYDTTKITAFVDVHDDLLYFSVIAWNPDSAGFIVDYGTFPQQKRTFFAKSDGGLDTLQGEFGGSSDGALGMGLQTLFADLLNARYPTENDERAEREIDRILVDSKYKPEVVESAIRLTRGKIIVPCRGYSIRATSHPMNEWLKKPGRLFGHHWIKEKVEKRIYQSYLADTNYWKSKLHEKFNLQPGEKGSLTFWGTDRRVHRMAAEHCNAESCQLVSSGRNEVNEWKEKPTRPDNHLFDCLVGSLIGASTLGLKTEDSPGRKGKQ